MLCVNPLAFVLLTHFHTWFPQVETEYFTMSATGVMRIKRGMQVCVYVCVCVCVPHPCVALLPGLREASWGICLAGLHDKQASASA